MTLDPRVRILAAATFAAALALVAGFMLLGGGQDSSQAAVKVIKPLHPVKKHAAPAKAPPKKTAVKVATRVVPRAAAKPKTIPAAKPKAVIEGVPGALAVQLRSHAIVVVSLYTPGSSVDGMATAEARKGAQLAHAGFVAFNVADENNVAPLTSLLTGAATPADRVLDGPAVLVFQRPTTLFVRFNGFADSDTVAQAAANAAALAR